MKLGAYLNIIAGVLVLGAGAIRGNWEMNLYLFFPLGIFFLFIGLFYLWRINTGK